MWVSVVKCTSLWYSFRPDVCNTYYNNRLRITSRFDITIFLRPPVHQLLLAKYYQVVILHTRLLWSQDEAYLYVYMYRCIGFSVTHDICIKRRLVCSYSVGNRFRFRYRPHMHVSSDFVLQCYRRSIKHTCVFKKNG